MLIRFTLLTRFQRNQSLRLFANTRLSGSEFHDFGDAVRAGELLGVPKSALDGCAVCNNVLGLNPNLPEWMIKWIEFHDGYDEWNAGSGAILGAHGNCPLRSIGKRCGKYCCSDMAHAEDVQ